MDKKLFMILSVGIVTIGLVFFVGYSVLKQDGDGGQGQDTDSGQNLKVEISEFNLELTSKSSFEVGQEFKYETTTRMDDDSTMNYEETFIVEKIERHNGVDCYVISSIGQMSDSSGASMAMEIEKITYVNKETGKIVQIDVEMGGLEMPMEWGEDALSFRGNGMYATWMLALKENLTWTTTMNTSMDVERMTTDMTYKVIGMEKINDTECFKVEITTLMKMSEDDQGTIKEIIWIDANKRIVVKSLSEIEELMTSEMNLVSETQ